MEYVPHKIVRYAYAVSTPQNEDIHICANDNELNKKLVDPGAILYIIYKVTYSPIYTKFSNTNKIIKTYIAHSVAEDTIYGLKGSWGYRIDDITHIPREILELIKGVLGKRSKIGIKDFFKRHACQNK